MGKDVEESLCNFLKSTKFSLQLDESSLPGNEAILLAYLPFIKEEDLAPEFLFARELVTDSKGKSIFQVVEGYFKEKEVPLANVISVATDGAPLIVGCQREGSPKRIGHSVRNPPSALGAKCLSERLHRSLQLVITAVNRIKSRPLRDRLFRHLCEENGEDFHRLLFHTEVGWLSQGTRLSRFYNLYASVLEFFEEDDASLCANLKKFEGDIAYMADLYMKFNEMNLQLQGEDLNLIKTKSVISARKGRINEQNVEVYWRHLELLHQDSIERFEDTLSLEEDLLQQQQVNEELKPKFKLEYRTLRLKRDIPRLYPGWNACRCGLANEEEKQTADCKSGDLRLQLS
ncbi:hypothetical protein M514_08566 [Trichuris suis]|uniref:DUF4371 domain-containing protein n=1 Tax=Trichuris suis TaxID=68888 RepID=A0A085LZV2_9BILA|nr:hypothetical protein M513_08566 [Trichuris suis]KFD63478.1 hypothetical protein M514_08566 [Trichuris suis]